MTLLIDRPKLPLERIAIDKPNRLKDLMLMRQSQLEHQCQLILSWVLKSLDHSIWATADGWNSQDLVLHWVQESLREPSRHACMLQHRAAEVQHARRLERLWNFRRLTCRWHGRRLGYVIIGVCIQHLERWTIGYIGLLTAGRRRRWSPSQLSASYAARLCLATHWQCKFACE